MARNAATLSSRQPSVGGRLVVIETDGFGARAAIVSPADGDNVSLETVAEASARDPLEAAKQAIDILRGQTKKMPRRAVLVTVEVTPAIFPLPRGLSQRPPRQVQSALRWEMEPRVAQSAGSRRLISILMGLGVVNGSQAGEILEAVNREHREVNPARRPLRSGETAEELGYADRSQVEQALELQTWFTAEDRELSCGWMTRTSNGAMGGNNWYVTSLCSDRRERWRSVLRGKGLALEGVYALAGASAALDSGSRGTGVCTHIQVERGFVAHVRLRGNSVEALEVRFTGEIEPTAKLCAEMLEPADAGALFLSGRVDRLQQIAIDLNSLCGRSVEVLAPAAGESEGIVVSRASLIGPARHALGRASPETLACVPASDPKTPLAHRPSTWWAASILAFGFTLAGVDNVLNSEADQALLDAQIVEQQREALRAERDRLNQEREKRDILLETLATAEDSLAALRMRLRCWQEEVPRRAGFLPGILDALVVSVDRSVFIDSIKEVRPYVVEIEGWALSDHAGQKFTSSLANRMTAEKLRVLEQSLRHRSDDEGGVYSMRVVLGPEEEVIQ